MRLFIAITFDETVKDAICSAINLLRTHTVRGNFTRRENLHLTLEFIGETLNQKAACRAIDSVRCAKFEMSIGGIGFFKSNSGKVCWLGIEKCTGLLELQNQIHLALIKEGFKLDARTYKPHLTLGRKVYFEDGFDIKTLVEADKPLTAKIDKASLMKSERKAGNLVYTEVHGIRLT